MKTGRTVQELAVELDRQNKAKRDFVLPSEKMHLADNGSDFHLCGEDTLDFRTTDLFHRQIGAALNIPAKYYDLCRAENPRLLAENVNSWLETEKDKRHMVRALDNTARAFLSDRYRRIDNTQIAEAVLPLIAEMPDARVESCEVRTVRWTNSALDNRMYLKVVNPRLQLDVVPGDTVQAGIVISNSEVGLGSVSIMPLVYRLVCTNGMVVNDAGQRKNHVGRVNDEAWKLFSDETIIADDKAFMLKLQDIVRTAIDSTKFAVIVNKLREATTARFTAPVTNVVELTAKNYGLSKSENDGILQHLIEGGDLSLYGLSNAVTRTAADIDSYDRATALESVGYQIITMPPKLWSAINERT
jgi:hypothetical protein